MNVFILMMGRASLPEFRCLKTWPLDVGRRREAAPATELTPNSGNSNLSVVSPPTIVGL